jgi:hypothetical protein
MVLGGGGGGGERLRNGTQVLSIQYFRNSGTLYTCMILIKQSAVRVKRDAGYRIVRGIYRHQLFSIRVQF